MAASGAAVAYCAAGGIILYSGIKGATIADTVKAVLAGNLNVTGTEPVLSGGGSGGSGTAAPGDTGAANAGAAANQALAKKIIQANPAYAGWDTGQEWADLVSLWNKESTWSNTADNPDSGAYGIPQALPYTKMPKAAWPPSAGGSADPATQIEWGLAYIAQRYGNPVMAWAHETANGWY